MPVQLSPKTGNRPRREPSLKMTLSELQRACPEVPLAAGPTGPVAEAVTEPPACWRRAGVGSPSQAPLTWLWLHGRPPGLERVRSRAFLLPPL